MLHDEILADARREAEHAREELKKARTLLATFTGLWECGVDIRGLPSAQALYRDASAFMRETTLYPKAEAAK